MPNPTTPAPDPRLEAVERTDTTLQQVGWRYAAAEHALGRELELELDKLRGGRDWNLTPIAGKEQLRREVTQRQAAKAAEALEEGRRLLMEHHVTMTDILDTPAPETVEPTPHEILRASVDDSADALRLKAKLQQPGANSAEEIVATDVNACIARGDYAGAKRVVRVAYKALDAAGAPMGFLPGMEQKVLRSQNGPSQRIAIGADRGKRLTESALRQYAKADGQIVETLNLATLKMGIKTLGQYVESFKPTKTKKGS